MKKEPKVRWTVEEYVPQLGEGKRVGFDIKIYNLDELGFKEAWKEFGKEYVFSFDIPIERYLAMSKEDKRRQCEEWIQGILTELTEIEKRHKQVEKTASIISKEIITGQTSVTHVKEERPLQIIDKELPQKIATEAKKLVYESPDMHKVLILKELLSVAENYGLDEKWVSTVGYLIIEEIALKQWLLQHGHAEQDLKKKDYYKLLEMLEKDFKKMGKPINARHISKFLGEREFRNRVLHEGYEPTPKDEKETKEMAISLLEFLKQH